jgi:hypothetical protein
MTQTTPQAHPDLANPIRTLRCTCCGQYTQGRQFHNQDAGHGLGDCCHDYVKPRVEDMERTYGIHGVHYKLDPVALVREVGQSMDTPQVEWRISQNLTDRWGEFNRFEEARKPLALLEGNPELLERLLAQMWDEITFVVRMDGQFGLLYEVEYCSRESEQGCDPEEQASDWFKNLRPQAVVEQALLKGMEPLAQQFPGVKFGVPDAQWIIEQRPAAWAFVPDGLLDEQQRETLGKALLAL